MKSIKRLFSVFAVLVLLVSACTSSNKSNTESAATSAVKYTCPMHRQIIKDRPGNCPICGMTLIKITGQPSEDAGISLNTVLQPVNSSVISAISTIQPQVKEVPVHVTAQGYLDFDSRNFNNISARFSGRIEKLYIKTAFQEIRKGQRIFDIYSPEMVTAQQDLIYLTIHTPQEAEMLNAAKQKLLLLGMTNAQVNQVIKSGKAFYSLPVYSAYDGHIHDVAHSQMSGDAEVNTEQNYTGNVPLTIREGMYVEKGQTLFNVADAHNLWALIKVKRDDMAGIKLNAPVSLSFPDIPGMTMRGKVNFIEPFLRAGDKNITLRVYLQNMDHHLKVNTLVNANIQTGLQKGIWVPKQAILYLGQTQVVWLKQGNLFKAHPVTTSISNSNEVMVTKGLNPDDTLAENAQYLTDSESFIKTQSHDEQQ